MVSPGIASNSTREYAATETEQKQWRWSNSSSSSRDGATIVFGDGERESCDGELWLKNKSIVTKRERGSYEFRSRLRDKILGERRSIA